MTILYSHCIHTKRNKGYNGTCRNVTFLFQNLCGTESHPVKFRAKKYKIEEKSFSLADFTQMMTHLPEPVTDQEIMEMFNYADKDRDGRINFEEFLVIFIIFVADYIFSLPGDDNSSACARCSNSPCQA